MERAVPTVIAGRWHELIVIRVLPHGDVHVIGNERGDVALEDGSVALNHEHVVHLRLVVLVDHCKEER